MAGRSYDSRCYDLAEHFLDDDPTSTEEDREKLAATIQQAIEDWFAKATAAEPTP